MEQLIGSVFEAVPRRPVLLGCAELLGLAGLLHLADDGGQEK
jgi:hypothetical protein